MNPDFFRVFVALFVIIDPVGNILVFHLLTQSMPPARRLAVAVAVAGAMLVLFSLTGQRVLEFLGISQPGFRVAAGLLLSLPAYELVTRGQLMESPDSGEVDPLQIGLVPMATPLLAGPGALAATISFSDSVGAPTTIAALLAVLLLCVVAFAAADWLFQRLGPALLRLLTRLVGILLFAIATDFVLSGARVALFGG